MTKKYIYINKGLAITTPKHNNQFVKKIRFRNIENEKKTVIS